MFQFVIIADLLSVNGNQNKIMKKIIIILIVIFTINNTCFSQKQASVYDINGKEAGIFIDLNDKNEFKEMFLFQYENMDLSIFSNYKDILLVEFDKDFIKLSCDNKIYLLSLSPNQKDDNMSYISGYGLSHRTGNYSLKLVENPSTISDIILLNGNSVNKAKPKCDSGGTGSSECSTSGGVVGGGADCSVKCNKGYYSCCKDAVNECTCVKG